MTTAVDDSLNPQSAAAPSGGREEVDDWHDEDFLSLDVAPTKPAAKEGFDSASADVGDSMDESCSDEADEGTSAIPWHPKLPPPWLERGLNDRNLPQIHPLTALHNEIVSFLHLMEPLPSEIEQRQKLVERISETVKQHFDDDTRVEVFGSQTTGLFLPTSDIDVVIITNDKKGQSQETKTTKNRKINETTEPTNGGVESKNESIAEGGNGSDVESYQASLPQNSPLQRFAKAIRQDWEGDLSYFETVEQTRIPLVKFTHATTNISIDVSFNQPTGPPAAQLMKRYLEALPPLRPLTFVLKYFLAARGLNEPYTGGVGSFMLQLLIVAFLQHRERDAVNFQRPSVYNLGSLLLEFFEMYGMEFNYLTTGISVRYDGFFFPKGAADRRAIFWKPDRMAMLALENPLDPTQDVGQSSFRFQTVQRAFAVAYKLLLAYVTAGPNEPDLRDVTSILAIVLPPTHYMTSRLVLKRRDRPLAAKRKNESSPSAVRGKDGKRSRWR